VRITERRAARGIENNAERGPARGIERVETGSLLTMGERKWLWRMLVVSVLAHLALVLVVPGLGDPPPPAEQRIKLTLAAEARDRVLAEPPESARVPEPPPDATNPAEWNAQAQNPEPAPEVDGRPRSTGDIEMFDFQKADLLSESARQRSRSERTREPVPEPDLEPVADPAREEGGDGERASGSVALGRSGGAETRDGREETSRRSRPATGESEEDTRQAGRLRPRHASPRSGTATTGELSLSTYEWAWAPYLKHLKEAISERWHPPLAFYMGLVEGDGTIRFRIDPSGAVTRIDLLAEKGHPSLARAARNAVDYAGPFRPLPDGFTDPYLDVTWHYRYILYGAAGSE
jgi:TonB family protein